jgi:hypothetical protein
LEVHEIARGRTLAFPVQLRDTAESPLTGVYDGTEPLALEVWAGDDRAPVPLAGSRVEWGGTTRDGAAYTAADGVITVTIDDADTALLEPGAYQLAVTLTDGGEPLDAYRALLRILPSAGTAVAAPAWVTADDLTDAFPSLLDLEDLDTEQAAAAEPRAEATAWLKDQVAARAEAALEALDRRGWWGSTSRTGLETIRTLLDADRLLIDDAARRILACYAVYRVLNSPVGKDGSNPYAKQAAAFWVQAVQRLAGWKARVDVDGDGVHELVLA